MVEYISLKEFKNFEKLRKLWNKEYKRTFPLSERMFQERVIDDQNLDYYASTVAVFEGSAIGFILIKTWQVESPFYKDENNAYISLIFVAKDYRDKHVGSELLEVSLKTLIKNEKIKELRLGDDILYLFPGLPNELNESTMFFLNRGFKSSEGVVDMIKVIKKKNKNDYNLTSKLEIRIATEDDKDNLLKLCLNGNYLKEAYLINHYFERGGTGRRLVVGSLNDKIVGFSRIYDRKKTATKINMFTDKTIGSLSMLVVDKSLNDFKEFQKDLSVGSEHYLIMRKCKKIIIESVSAIDYYKELGYRVFKYYLNFVLNLDEFRNKI